MSTLPSHDQTAEPAATTKVPMAAARYFYSGAALGLAALTFWGFESFYLHGTAPEGEAIRAPIRTLVVVHGVVMTAWMLVFVLQPQLIARRKYTIHMRVGKIGATLAAIAVVLGSFVAVESARLNMPDTMTWGLDPRQFLTFTLVPIWMFGLLVFIAVANRNHPDIHRPMMLTAVLAAMPPPFFRIAPLTALFIDSLPGRVFGPFAPVLVVGLVFVMVKWILYRRFDRWLAIGVGGLAVSSAALMKIATTAAWENFASVLV